MPERHFVAELRQKLLAFLPDRPVEVDLETLGQAFAPLRSWRRRRSGWRRCVTARKTRPHAAHGREDGREDPR